MDFCPGKRSKPRGNHHQSTSSFQCLEKRQESNPPRRLDPSHKPKLTNQCRNLLKAPFSASLLCFFSKSPPVSSTQPSSTSSRFGRMRKTDLELLAVGSPGICFGSVRTGGHTFTSAKDKPVGRSCHVRVSVPSVHRPLCNFHCFFSFF